MCSSRGSSLKGWDGSSISEGASTTDLLIREADYDRWASFFLGATLDQDEDRRLLR